ncbi:GNAT family N-acetyltransferase [Streptomyces sp. NPDC059853]|uniref:GNAT family N-acetyltransferase n=1 Tax=Streptomyces sp. NPDC059853 TaxID=3346973 RepID=UPI00366317F4
MSAEHPPPGHPHSGTRTGTPVRTAAVPVSAVLRLRAEVLRPGLPPERAEFAEDRRPGTVHLAAYAGETGTEVLGCITLFADPLPGDATAHRFRGMATDPAVRGRGYGAALLAAAEAEAAARGAGTLWCNGRTGARGFYERHGYTVLGEEFLIEGVGPHYVFIRRLAPRA